MTVEDAQLVGWVSERLCSKSKGGRVTHRCYQDIDPSIAMKAVGYASAVILTAAANPPYELRAVDARKRPAPRNEIRGEAPEPIGFTEPVV